MSKRTFTQQQQDYLQSLNAVQSCTSKSITYTKGFKAYALHAYLQDYRNIKEIFESEGFNLDIIGHDRPHQCITRWKRDGIES